MTVQFSDGTGARAEALGMLERVEMDGSEPVLHIRKKDDTIVKATSPLDNRITLGNLCVKGRFGWRFVQNA